MTERQEGVRGKLRSAARLTRRRRAERRFRALGAGAISLALATLFLLLASVVVQGHGAFFSSFVELEIDFDATELGMTDPETPAEWVRADWSALVRKSLRERFPAVHGRKTKRRLYRLLSVGAGQELQRRVVADSSLLGTRQSLWLPLAAEADRYGKGAISLATPEDERKLDDAQIGWLEELDRDGRIDTRVNWRFLTGGDSREPELAGIGGALVGTFFTLALTLLFCFPLGVATAVYLEEFAPRNRWTDWIEVNINNLAAVPSIIFGLLGLAFFLGFLGLPRSAPLVGGLVLAIRTLPVVIIASRAALGAVAPSLREAALGMGASPVQVVAHHVLPQAMPGILTGTIIGMAQALGETAPLLMIGMVAFVVDVPTGLQSPSTVLPVQIFLWADAPERAFVEKTAGAILVLLGFLVSMNATAVLLRQRFGRRG